VEEEKEEGREAAHGGVAHLEARSRPREEPDPPGTSASTTSPASPTTRRRLPPLLPRRPAAPPLFTDVLHFGQWPPR
jgi:hypothetical protein